MGQTVGANRRLTFDLMNCPTGSVRVIGATVVVPTSATIFPNPAGMLAGAIIGNDIIACDSTVGQTWYRVAIWIGNTKAFEKNYRITGAMWDISTAVPLVSDPTAFLTYTGYLSQNAYAESCIRLNMQGLARTQGCRGAPPAIKKPWRCSRRQPGSPRSH